MLGLSSGSVKTSVVSNSQDKCSDCIVIVSPLAAMSRVKVTLGNSVVSLTTKLLSFNLSWACRGQFVYLHTHLLDISGSGRSC